MKRNKIFNYLFYLLYISVSVATFRHSAFGFASLEGGSFWWGALSALAVDAGMILSASSLRYTRNFWLIALLIACAFGSSFTQVLYAISNAPAVTVAPGAVWLGETAVRLINWRILLLPLFLPASAVMCAFSAKLDNSTRSAGLDARVNEILSLNLGKKETAAEIWQLSRNGYGDFSVNQVAQWVGCSPRTAQSAKPEGEK